MLKRDNIFLVEFHEPAMNENTEVTKYKLDESKAKKAIGYRIYSVYNSDSERLAIYDANEDTIDLSPLLDKKGDNLVFVSKTENNDFIWKTTKINDTVKDDNENTIISIIGTRECTEEESEFLDEVFPEYLDNAY
jgi:hypothetical protein